MIGSGYHLEVSNDDGCAIAGAGSNAKGTCLGITYIANQAVMAKKVKLN